MIFQKYAVRSWCLLHCIVSHFENSRNLFRVFDLIQFFNEIFCVLKSWSLQNQFGLRSWCTENEDIKQLSFTILLLPTKFNSPFTILSHDSLNFAVSYHIEVHGFLTLNLFFPVFSHSIESALIKISRFLLLWFYKLWIFINHEFSIKRFEVLN